MKINLSIFNSKGILKIPQSPYNDEVSFDFETISVNFKDLDFYFTNNFILNRNYCFKTPQKLRKTKNILSKYLCEKIEYIILDIDKIFCENDYNQILNIFKELDYSIHLQKSRSFNGKSNFNLKGLLLVEGYNNEEGIKEFLNQFQRLIGRAGEIDLSVSREATHQAPTILNEVVLHKIGNQKPLIRKIEKTKTFKIEDHSVLMVCIDYLSSLGFIPVKEKDEMIIFRHPREKTPKGYFLFKNNPFILHHFNPSKSLNIFKNVIKNKVVKEYFKKLNEEKIKEIFNFKEGKTKNSIFLNEKFLQIDEEKKEFIKEFLSSKKGVLKIKSPMGTGKSNIIEEVLKQNEDKRVLFITNRISIAKDIKAKYPETNLKLYNEDEFFIGDNLICQFDSLWKYDLKHFDLIILDEFMSLLFHIRNNLTSRNVLNKVKFFYALKKSHIIILDALFFGIENKFIKPTHKIINNFREEIEIKLYDDKFNLLSKELKTIQNEIKESRKVTISCSTKILANSINEFLKSKGIKSIVLDSNTSESEKNFIFENFKDGKNFEVFIYSPTITVGISFTFESNLHLHFDESSTIDVISSIQQIKRNRNAKKIFMYVKEVKRNLIFDEEILLNDFKKELDFNNKKIDIGFLIDLDENGSFKPSKFAEFLFKIEALFNLLENNHQFSFKTLLKNQFKFKLELNKRKIENFLKKYTAIYKEKEEKKNKKIILNDLKRDNIKEELLNFFKTLNDDEVKYLFLKISKNSLFLEKVKFLHLFLKGKFREFYLTQIDEKILSKDEKMIFNFILLLEQNKFKLEERYTITQLKKINYPLEHLRKFLNFLGFEWKYNSYILDKNLKDLSKKFII